MSEQSDTSNHPTIGEIRVACYDSRPETREHIKQVRSLLKIIINDLAVRMFSHDDSKLVSPEVEVFDRMTPLLKTSTYGSEEYKGFLKEMGEGLAHHYANNSHHPEHYENGINGMSLLDIMEMLCDWKAATLRHADGDIRKSIEINQKRFDYSDELKQIFLNTLPLIEDNAAVPYGTAVIGETSLRSPEALKDAVMTEDYSRAALKEVTRGLTPPQVVEVRQWFFACQPDTFWDTVSSEARGAILELCSLGLG